jgi:hypothetical protein
MPANDRAGPILLLSLLALAFIPSLSREFDLSRLLSALATAVGRLAAPPPSLQPAGTILLPVSEAEARLISVASSNELPHAVPLVWLDRSAPGEPGLCGFEWPPRPAISPRAPPPSA